MPRADGPFEVLRRLNKNAYKVNLPGDYGVSCTFNVADLSPDLEDGHLVNFKANSLQLGEDDGGPSIEDELGPQNNQGSSGTNTNVQGMIQTLLRQSSGSHGLEPMQNPISSSNFLSLEGV